MPTLETPVLPREVGSKLARVRVKLRAVELALASERTVLALFGAAVVSFVLDTGIEPELGELVVMRTLTLFLFGTAACAGVFFAGRALRRRLNDDAVAVLVENEFPELQDGLVSSVQLARDLERGGLGFTSPALIRSTIARTAARSKDLDFDRVIDASPLLLPSFLTLLALVGGGLFAHESPTDVLAQTWWQRCILGKEVRYPKSIELEIGVPNEKDGQTWVARGDDVVVTISVKRGVRRVNPDRLFVKTYALRRDEGSGQLDLLDKEPEKTRPTQIASATPGQFRKVYQNVTEPFEFLVDAGNNVRSERHRVVVVDRPRVEEAKFWLKFPEYMGLPDTPREKPETQPDMRVPVGTEIEYRVLTNKRLSKAELKIELEDQKAAKGPKGEPLPAPEQLGPPPSLGGEGKEAGRVLAGKLTVQRSMRFHFSLVSTESYDDGKKPVVYSVTAVVDHPPEVRFLIPGRPKEVTPAASVPMKIQLTDDYGVYQAEIRFKVDGQDRPAIPGAPGPPAGEEKIPLPGLQEGTRQATLEYRMELAELALKPGSRVLYKAVAFDRNIEVEKRMGESTSYVLQVISKEDLARKLQDRLQRLKEELNATAKLEHQSHDDTDTMVHALVAKTKLDDEDKRRLLLADYEQRKVTSRLTSVAQEIERIVEERELNHLDDERELDREKDLRDAAKDLAERISPIVSQKLDDARRSPELDPHTKAILAKVPDLQEEVEKAILLLAARIEKWADFADIVREVRDIFSEQQRLIGVTEDEIKRQNKGSEAPPK